MLCCVSGAQAIEAGQNTCEQAPADKAKQSSLSEASTAPAAHTLEWEQDASDLSSDMAISHLFEDGQQREEIQEHISLPGLPPLSVCSISRSQRHTLSHTGALSMRPFVNP